MTCSDRLPLRPSASHAARLSGLFRLLGGLEGQRRLHLVEEHFVPLSDGLARDRLRQFL